MGGSYWKVVGPSHDSIYCESISILRCHVKTAKIFKNGQSQAVRLPKEFRFEDDEVFIKKTGSVVLLIPKRSSWDSLLNSLEKFSSDYMDERGQPSRQTRRERFR